MPSPSSSDLFLTQASEDREKSIRENTLPSKKGLKFWLILLSMCACLFLSSLELCSVSTALPTIANALHASQFTWVGTAYALSAAVFNPMSGGLAQAYGRRPALLVTIGLFALGSGVSGGANNMNMLIVGRTIQGLGGGGIQSLTNIILADLVTLKERGLYIGLYWLTTSIAAAIGPIIGGALAAQGQWCWLFYLNLPISLVACASAVFLLDDLPVPPGSFQEKFMRMDWIGNFLVISSTVSCAIGLTWGGVTAPWGSATVLVPLVLGFVGFAVFIAYEATYATHPLVPFSLMTDLTCISGYIQKFCVAVLIMGVVYFCPVYYQACKGASPYMAGLYGLAFASVAPSALISGISVKVTKRYRPQMWVGWIIVIVGFGLASTILATDPLAKSIGYFVMLGFGAGILSGAVMFPVQAPLSVTQSAPALAFFCFVNSFAAVWGITIGGTVLQNVLGETLPASFIQSVPEGTAIVYALIPELSMLPLQTRLEVQAAFAESLAVLWRVFAGVCGFGLVASLFMKGLPLHDTLDEDWTLKNKSEELD